MIKLDPAVIAEQKLDHFNAASQPTHAKRVLLHVSSVPADTLSEFESGIVSLLGQDIIRAVYLYGTLDAKGTFVPTLRAPVVHAIIPIQHPAFIPLPVDPKDAEAVARADVAAKRNAAIYNLRRPGFAPVAATPWEPVAAPVGQDEFKDRDLEAFFSNPIVGDPRLRGTVV